MCVNNVVSYLSILAHYYPLLWLLFPGKDYEAFCLLLHWCMSAAITLPPAAPETSSVVKHTDYNSYLHLLQTSLVVLCIYISQSHDVLSLWHYMYLLYIFLYLLSSVVLSIYISPECVFFKIFYHVFFHYCHVNLWILVYVFFVCFSVDAIV